jgi:hypothetical protein
MGSIPVDIAPPSFWQHFELLTLDICKQKWQDDYAERNGRSGQAQHGVDVYGYNRHQGEYTGVQCKKRKRAEGDVERPSGTLNQKEIQDEIKLARTFVPALSRFIIATTGARDEALQSVARAYNRTSKDFQLTIWFWDDYVEHLNNNPSLMYRYYDNVLKYRNEYTREEHYYRMLAMAFDRPAIRTEISMENRVVDLIDALAATQQAVATGRLVDREHRLIDEVLLPESRDSRLDKIRLLLQQARDLATRALNDGTIVQHPTVIEIRSPQVAQSLNTTRMQAIDLLNELLREQQLAPVAIQRY